MKRIVIGILFLTMAFGADFMSIPYTFVARQLISATKIMSNYTSLRNAMIDGSKKINIAEVWINGTIRINTAGNYTGGNVSGTTATFTDATISTINVRNLKLTTLSSAPTPSVTGNIYIDTAGQLKWYSGATHNVVFLSGTTINVSVLKLSPRVTTPSAPVTGDMFFNAGGSLQGYDGSAWNAAW